MNITPDALALRIGAGLDASVQNDPLLHELAAELGQEILEYGVSVLPRELFRGRSGAEVAALVAEDLEAALWAKPLLAPRTVSHPAPVTSGAGDDGDGEAPASEPVVETVTPRVVELGCGWGVTAFVLALANPDQTFELVEPSRPRLWWWRRLASLYRAQNFRVHPTSHADFVAGNVGAVDVVITKNLTPGPALDLALPLVRVGGRVLSFQRSDRAAEVRKPRTNADGVPVRFEDALDFRGPAARGRQLLCLGVGTQSGNGTGSTD